MGDIILFFISLFFIGIIVFLSFRSIKKSNSLAEKIGELIIVIIMVVLMLMYYVDRYNIATNLKLEMNVDTQNWFSFIGNYITGIISAVIGGLVAVWTTVYQIRKNNEENNKRDFENLRIQNMPILKYSVSANKNKLNELENLIVTNINDGTPYELKISLKNIGLNNIKNIKVDFQSELINNSIQRILGKDSIVAVEKGEEIVIEKFFSLKSSDKPYKILITVYYEDVLANWYKQLIKVNYAATNRFESGEYIGDVKCVIEEEEKIRPEDVIL